MTIIWDNLGKHILRIAYHGSFYFFCGLDHEERAYIRLKHNDEVYEITDASQDLLRPGYLNLNSFDALAFYEAVIGAIATELSQGNKLLDISIIKESIHPSFWSEWYKCGKVTTATPDDII